MHKDQLILRPYTLECLSKSSLKELILVMNIGHEISHSGTGMQHDADSKPSHAPSYSGYKDG